MLHEGQTRVRPYSTSFQETSVLFHLLKKKKSYKYFFSKTTTCFFTKIDNTFDNSPHT